MMVKRTTLLAGLVLLNGCATLAEIDPTGISRKKKDAEERQLREANEAADRQQRQEQEQKEAEAVAQRQEQAEATAQRQAEEKARLEAQARQTQLLVLKELGVSVKVPGDVTAKVATLDGVGTPALHLSGTSSKFELFVTDASSDRYDLDERITRYHTDFRYGMQVIRKHNRPDGSWAFEFTFPQYNKATGARRTLTGYFSRKVVGGKKVNCLIHGVPESSLSGVVDACATVAVAR